MTPIDEMMSATEKGRKTLVPEFPGVKAFVLGPMGESGSPPFPVEETGMPSFPALDFSPPDFSGIMGQLAQSVAPQETPTQSVSQPVSQPVTQQPSYNVATNWGGLWGPSGGIATQAQAPQYPVTQVGNLPISQATASDQSYTPGGLLITPAGSTGQIGGQVPGSTYQGNFLFAPPTITPNTNPFY